MKTAQRGIRGRYSSKHKKIHIFEKPLFAKYLMYICIGLDSYNNIGKFVKRYDGIPFYSSNMSPFIKEFVKDKFIKLDKIVHQGKRGYSKGFKPNWDIIVNRFFLVMQKDIDDLQMIFQERIRKLDGLQSKHIKPDDKQFKKIRNLFGEAKSSIMFFFKPNQFKAHFSTEFKMEILVPSLQNYFCNLLIAGKENRQNRNKDNPEMEKENKLPKDPLKKSDIDELYRDFLSNLTLDNLFRQFIMGVGFNFSIIKDKKTKTKIGIQDPFELGEQMYNEKVGKDIEEFVFICKEYLHLKYMLDSSFFACLGFEEQIKTLEYHRVEKLEIPETNPNKAYPI